MSAAAAMEPTPASSGTSSPASSVASSSTDLKSMENKPLRSISATSSKGKSLSDRSKIPPSFFVTWGCIFSLQYYGGLWSMDSLYKLQSSVATATGNFSDWMDYVRNVFEAARTGDPQLELAEYARVAFTLVLGFLPLYIFFLAPLRAGLWTSRRALRHKFHRFMGLLYLAQYSLAWIEFLTDYENSAKYSLLPHTVALNGILQTWSAFFSFKVLPELEDAGYYSDKAVMSRKFVHENVFFTLMTVYGSIIYYPTTREVLRSHVAGRILENVFTFWPYILIRTWFPITRFQNAGATYKGRTTKNQRFYEVATVLVKIFFLWAKYYLGFFMNFLIFLDLIPEDSWKFLQGMLLFNIGTVSTAMFLHTLRFRKVLPPKFTFSVYLLQIYATFFQLPTAIRLFTSHPKLCGLAMLGLLCNMTRSRKMHFVWCVGCCILLHQKDIVW